MFINKAMKSYMERLLDKNIDLRRRNTRLFSADAMPDFNKRVKNGNYYGYDKYGVIVRKNCVGNSKSPFGWKQNDDGEIVSIHIKNECPEDLKRKETVIYIQSKFSSQWNSRASVLRKIYEAYGEHPHEIHTVREAQDEHSAHETFDDE